MYIIGNWKMNPGTEQEAKEIIKELDKGLVKIDLKGKKIIICPPFLYLTLFNKNDKIILGAQNLSFKKKGAFTGEISVYQLKDIGVKYVIIGHMERRMNFSETDSIINKKIKIALENSLIPVFCIGESLKEKEENKTIAVLKKQIKEGLKDISNNKDKIIIAYEPVWAIRTELIPAYDEVLKIKKEIKKILNNLNFDFPIVYGGSVNKNNIQGFIKKSKMDGVLVGQKSLDPKDFIQIIQVI